MSEIWKSFERERFKIRREIREGKRKCENEGCGSQEDLTIDHVVPNWLLRRLYLLNVEVVPFPLRVLCRPCNFEKAGIVQYEDERVKVYMRYVANAILYQCNE